MTTQAVVDALRKARFDVRDALPCPARPGRWTVYVTELPKSPATSEKRCAKAGLILCGDGWESGKGEFIEVEEVPGQVQPG